MARSECVSSLWVERLVFDAVLSDSEAACSVAMAASNTQRDARRRGRSALRAQEVAMEEAIDKPLLRQFRQTYILP